MNTDTRPAEISTAVSGFRGPALGSCPEKEGEGAEVSLKVWRDVTQRSACCRLNTDYIIFGLFCASRCFRSSNSFNRFHKMESSHNLLTSLLHRRHENHCFTSLHDSPI